MEGPPKWKSHLVFSDRNRTYFHEVALKILFPPETDCLHFDEILSPKEATEFNISISVEFMITINIRGKMILDLIL